MVRLVKCLANYTMVVVHGTSYTITGLQPFTNYTVTVQANNAPVVEFGPPLSEVFATLPEATVPPGQDPPSVGVPLVGTGSSAVVDIVIPPPANSQNLLSHLWMVCIRNILPTTRSTAPDTAFPDNSTFATYDNALDNVPYIASKFDPAAEGISFPYLLGVGNESEPNDFPGQYRNGLVMAGRALDCFVRYIVSTEALPARRKRDAIANRQYDVYQSTGYVIVNTAPDPILSGVEIGAVAGLVACALIVAVTVPLVVFMIIHNRKQDKKAMIGNQDCVITGNPNANIHETAIDD